MKIDTSKIEGFDKMTAEEKVAALTGFEMETATVDEQRYKDLISKASAEAAEYKRQLREKQTEAERQAAEAAEREAAREAELKGYRDRERASNYRARLLESGFDPETAERIAGGLPDGIGDDFFSAQRELNERLKQSAINRKLDNQPDLTGGVAPTAAQIEKNEQDKLRRYAGL